MNTAQGTTVICNGQLVDGNGGPPVADAVVVVQDGRIQYAGPAAGGLPLPSLIVRWKAVVPWAGIEGHFQVRRLDGSYRED